MEKQTIDFRFILIGLVLQIGTWKLFNVLPSNYTKFNYKNWREESVFHIIALWNNKFLLKVPVNTQQAPTSRQ